MTVQRGEYIVGRGRERRRTREEAIDKTGRGNWK